MGGLGWLPGFDAAGGAAALAMWSRAVTRTEERAYPLRPTRSERTGEAREQSKRILVWADGTTQAARPLNAECLRIIDRGSAGPRQRTSTSAADRLAPQCASAYPSAMVRGTKYGVGCFHCDRTRQTPGLRRPTPVGAGWATWQGCRTSRAVSRLGRPVCDARHQPAGSLAP